MRMANVHLDPTALLALEAYMEAHGIESKSRAVDRLIATDALAQSQECAIRALELAVDTLKDENEMLKNLRGN